MKKKALNNFKNTIFITKDMLRDVSNENEESLSKSILRWCKRGELLKLKNGLYITKETYSKHINTDGFIELIANKLRTPSYVSLEYALSKYGVITESVYTVTSITLKTKRTFNNLTGQYIYKSIKKSLFNGYKLEKFLSNDYYIATKEKALFDYLYFKAQTLPEDISNLNIAEELRLNLDSFTKKDFNKLSKYGTISNSKKLISIINNIKQYASNRV
jgi:predicted transcriptional regulator of viral defense system